MRRSVPASRDRLMDLALPAIGLWPQRRADIPAVASRFVGTPPAPPDWEWPTFEDEPMLFVGQIDCAELRGLPAAEPLPPHGVLAFFGDHDAVQGGDSWHERRLSLAGCRSPCCRAATDRADFDLSGCAVAPRPISISPSLQHRRQQAPVREGGAGRLLRCLAGDPGTRHSARMRPLCRLQQALGLAGSAAERPLAIRSRTTRASSCRSISYCNGETLHGWGTGGNLYYLLPECDLRARFYDNCDFEGQFT